MSPEAAMCSLPTEERRVMTLRFVYSYTETQIAVRLRMDRAQVLKILAMAIYHFAEALEQTDA